MFSKNLRKYRESLRMTRESLAYRLRVLHNMECTGANIQNWEKGTNPKIETISALADVLGIPEQFLFDDSEKAINKIIDKQIPRFSSMTEHTKKVPLLDGYVGAGSAGYASYVAEGDTVNYLYVDNYMIKKKYRDKEILAMIVIGDSMQPYVNDGDIVLFSDIRGCNHRHTDGKYIIETINGTMVKNLRFKSNGDVVISSCNKAYGDEIIESNVSQERLDIIGVVVGRVLKN